MTSEMSPPPLTTMMLPGHECCAEHYCSKLIAGLPEEFRLIDDPPQHKCVECQNPLHGASCGQLFHAQREILYSDVSDPEKAKEVEALICFICIEKIGKEKMSMKDKESEMMDEEEEEEEEEMEQTDDKEVKEEEEEINWAERVAKTIANTPPMAGEKIAKKKKRPQKEFSAHDKLKILRELEVSSSGRRPPVSSIAKKYEVDRRTIQRWIKNKPRLIVLVEQKNKGNYKRFYGDSLEKVKEAVSIFYKSNMELPPEKRLAITGSVVAAKALQAAEAFLTQHRKKPYLSADEVKAMTEFKGSESWGRTIARRMAAAKIPPKKKRPQKEFSVQEKLRILEELDDPGQARVGAIAKKYEVDRRTIQRWIKNKEQLVFLAEQKNKGNYKRIYGDALEKVKEAVTIFYNTNMDLPPGNRISITGSIIASKALQAAEILLSQHAEKPFLSNEEVKAMTEFKGSESWGRTIARKIGHKSPQVTLRQKKK